MPLKINVPYNEKESAKAKGAFWDIQEKTWYVPNHIDVNDFANWIPQGNYSIIIKTPFYVALNTRECWKCSQETTVIAIASNSFYSMEDDNMQWSLQNHFSFLSMPTYIEPQLSLILEKVFPFYKIGYSRTVDGNYWANHCQKCGALQGDFHLHHEAEAAFFPISTEECEALTLILIDSKFDVKVEAQTSYGSNAEEIVLHAKKLDMHKYLNLQ
jgi:hypothetical protein